MIDVELLQLAYARSGDKGNDANIGLILRKPEFLPFVYRQVTADAVGRYFSHWVYGEVQRFELPGLCGFNFLMRQALGGGGAGSLRVDNQGKSLGQLLLSMRIRIPQSLL